MVHKIYFKEQISKGRTGRKAKSKKAHWVYLDNYVNELQQNVYGQQNME
jgi:hypothetical protein